MFGECKSCKALRSEVEHLRALVDKLIGLEYSIGKVEEELKKIPGVSVSEALEDEGVLVETFGE